MLHSGSRNVGNTTAAHYDGLARDALKQTLPAHLQSRVPAGLNYMEIDSEEGQAYL